KINGVSLNQFWARTEVMLAPHIRRSGRIEKWLPTFKHVAETLLEMVTTFHKRGVILGDLSPRNILINVETLQMWVIDLESATRVDEDDAKQLKFGARWGTTGFFHPARASRNRLIPEDDLYSLAMLLYSCVVPVNALFELSPEAERIFLDNFVKLG